MRRLSAGPGSGFRFGTGGSSPDPSFLTPSLDHEVETVVGLLAPTFAADRCEAPTKIQGITGGLRFQPASRDGGDDGDLDSTSPSDVDLEVAAMIDRDAATMAFADEQRVDLGRFEMKASGYVVDIYVADVIGAEDLRHRHRDLGPDVRLSVPVKVRSDHRMAPAERRKEFVGRQDEALPRGCISPR
jgi:hypothetical protein